MRALNLDQLRTLVEVVEQGSFTEAAKRLNLSQPAVSLQIRELEARFGLKLVERLGKRAYATPPGRELMAHARRLLQDGTRATDAMRRYNEGWLGRVHIGTNATVLVHLLPPVLRSLRDTHPTIELVITTGTSTGVVERVMANDIDLGLVTLPVQDSALEVTPVRSELLVAVLPAGLADIPDKVTPDYLARQTLILDYGRASMYRLIMAWFAEVGLAPRPAMELDSMEAIKAVVAAGIGVSILPQSSLEAGIYREEVVVRPLAPPISRTLALVQRQGKPQESALQYVREALLTLSETQST